MLFRIYYETAGGHTHMRIFAGKSEGALGKCGDLCMRNEEFEIFRICTHNIEFRPESRKVTIGDEWPIIVLNPVENQT